MSPRIWIWLVLVPAWSRSHADNFDGLNEAVGVNQTLEQGFGARQSGMAITFPSFQRDADAVANSPAAMNDVDDFTFSTAHSEKFGVAKFDNFAFLFPFESNSTMGLGLSRYGVSGIDSRPADGDPFQSEPDGVFSIADYLLVGSFARRWGGLDMGVNLNLLYRHLDQEGLGMRGDAQAQYTWDGRFRVGALLKGLVPSSARWESGYAEYEAPELYLGGAARFPAPYFYGNLEAAWQSEGVFHQGAKSATNLNGGTAFKNPSDFLAASNLGLEFLFDFGMAVRFGVNEFSKKSFTDVATFGIGYNWRHILGLDYSFSPHPGLLSTHQVSLQFTPAFPKFNGRDFRNRYARGNGSANPATGSAPSGSEPETAPEPSAPQSESPAVPESPAPEAKPAQTPANPVTVPKPAAVPEKAKAPAAGAPAGDKEILDNEDEGQ
ncbi:MAG: hypothetical protein JWO30_2650 [Fibrobacteres bacterium]|nr:hypothetical protein [Fibrobacterota bacterium]